MTTRATRPPDTASRVWTALHEFVAGQDRRRALRAALDLGLGKVEVLIKLADGPMTLREIARAAEIDPPAATVGVDQLEARGLVHRTPHPDDNRRKLVHLTDAGRDAAQRGQAILSEPPPALTNLDPDDLARLDEILTRLQNPTPEQWETAIRSTTATRSGSSRRPRR
jgi:DNA-binding MarR family transcriptional regulator